MQVFGEPIGAGNASHETMQRLAKYERLVVSGIAENPRAGTAALSAGTLLLGQEWRHRASC
jgi:hypothetical protein